MGDINHAGGENVWSKLVGFGKDIWITELDRRVGCSILFGAHLAVPNNESKQTCAKQTQVKRPHLERTMKTEDSP